MVSRIREGPHANPLFRRMAHFHARWDGRRKLRCDIRHKRRVAVLSDVRCLRGRYLVDAEVDSLRSRAVDIVHRVLLRRPQATSRKSRCRSDANHLTSRSSRRLAGLLPPAFMIKTLPETANRALASRG